jgi:hypothetical protein
MRRVRSILSKFKHGLQSIAFTKGQAASSEAQTFFWDTEHYTIDGIVYDTSCLIISFEDAFNGIDRRDVHRLGWGAKLFRKKKISHLCFKPKSVDWYRHPDFPNVLTELRNTKVFSQFPRTIAYGGSMGGFAALTFADHLGVTNVLALNPQTTLDKDLVPWETRFERAQRQDWKTPFADAVGGSDAVRQVVIICDPFVSQDALHVARLDQSNLVCLRAPFLGHGVASSLTKLGALASMLEGIISGSLDKAVFYKSLRRRKTLPRHLDILDAHPRVINSPKFSAIVAKARSQLT